MKNWEYLAAIAAIAAIAAAEERRQIAVRILGDSAAARDIADRHIGSPASLVEVCCRKALEGFYAVQETRDVDADELPKARSL